MRATVAQQVEQLTRNEQVVRSNRISSSKDPAFGRVFFYNLKSSGVKLGMGGLRLGTLRKGS